MKSYSILIADDDSFVRSIVEKVGLELGWSVDLAANGEEALKRVRERSHQVFVLDVKMPAPSGIELARKIMEREEAPAILILTGYAEMDRAVEAVKEGVFDYIQKDTIEIEGLKRALKHAAMYHESRLWGLHIRREREKTFRDIDRANKEFQAIIQLSSDLIFILNARTGQITDCNESACEKLEYSRKELLAKHMFDLSPTFNQATWEETVKRLQNGKLPEIETLFHRQSGENFFVEISLAYVGLETGEYVAAIARDITVRKRLEEESRHYFDRLHTTLIHTIRMVAMTVEKRDPYTAGHQQRAARLAVEIAKVMGVNGERREGLNLGCLIHDIGKIYVPSEILSKPGQLRAEEFNLIKMHAREGYEIVKHVQFPWPIDRMILQHHERMNGSGYPNGLIGSDIILEAKIIGVADVVEAMASHRPYRPALGEQKAFEEIVKNRGVLYDPEVVDACLQLKAPLFDDADKI
ncbi:MAG: HD domain-containing phosphohydrolase [Candidatus Omnitrophota bacterium]